MQHNYMSDIMCSHESDKTNYTAWLYEQSVDFPLPGRTWIPILVNVSVLAACLKHPVFSQMVELTLFVS